MGRLDLGVKALEEGKWADAIYHLNLAIQNDPHTADAYFARGFAHKNNKQYENAIKDFTDALRKKTDYEANSYYERAYCYGKVEQYQEAIKDFSAALKLEPSMYMAYALRGRIYHTVGKYQDALDDFNQAIAIDPSATFLYKHRGKAYHQLDLLDKALADLDHALHHDPDADAFSERAQVYFTLKRDEECLADAQQAARLSPEHPFAYHLLGMLFYRNGDRRQALAYYDQAAECGDDLAAEHAAQLRDAMLEHVSAQDEAPIQQEALALPVCEGEPVPAQLAQQQRQFIRAYFRAVIGFNQGIHQIQQQLAERKQIAQSQLTAEQRSVTTVSAQAGTLRTATLKRLKELSLNYTEPPGQATLTANDVTPAAVEDELNVARAALTGIERAKKPDYAWLLMLCVPLVFLVNIFAGSALTFWGGIALCVIIAVGMTVASSSWESETRATAEKLLAQLKKIEVWAEAQEQARVAENHRQRMAEIERQFEQQEKEYNQELGRQMGEWTGAAMNFEQWTAHISPPWDAPAWAQWAPPTSPVLALRVGSFQPELFENFPLPVSVDFPGSHALMFHAGGALKAPAVAAIQALILRLLATIPPGRVQFTFIDPIGLGQNVAPFMSLADHNEALVAGKAWSEPHHIEQQLTALTEHMENVIQKYLRHKYATIEDYNHEAGEIAEPYKVLVVLDFPVNFHDEALRRLLSIAQHGPRCGVFTVMLVDTEKPQPSGFNFVELARASTVISKHPERDSFIIEDADLKVFELGLDSLPDAVLIHRITEQVGKASLSASKVEVLFERIAPSAPTWDADHDLDLLEIPMGPSGAQKSQSFTLGVGKASHALVVGQTGSGKSNLLHVLITGIAMKYAPDDVELYLLDFKKGVEFKTYAIHQLPHARVIAIESEREFGLSVLEGLYREYERRGDLFRELGFSNLKTYRKQTGQKLSRILLLVDEFQKFFVEQDGLASRAMQLLEALVREGRSFGIHVLLASQNLTGSAALPESVKGSFGVRIALQCSEADARLILAEDNPAARLLSRPGEAVYNAMNGRVEGNSKFQAALLFDEQLSHYLQQIRHHAEAKSYRPAQIVFEGDQPADLRKNTALMAALEAAPEQHPRSLRAWLGDPVAIKAPVTVDFRRQSGANLLIIGTTAQTARGLIATTLLSLGAQLPQGQIQGAPTFSVLDFSADDAGVDLQNLTSQLPYSLAYGRQKQLGTMLQRVAQEVQLRLDANKTGTRPLFLFLYGLHRARDLRQDGPGTGTSSAFAHSFSVHDTAPDALMGLDAEDDLGMVNSFGAAFGSANSGLQAASITLPEQLALILREGPDVGVHTVAWCDTMANLSRVFDHYSLREFVLRVGLQMSESDSQTLAMSSTANKLGPNRALLYDDEAGTVEKFQPYALPDPAWLSQTMGLLTRRNGG